MFWAWVHGHLDSDIIIQPQMADIQQLNQQALGEAPWALTKVSIPTYLDPQVQDHYQLLSVGAALGRGCGPLIVAKNLWSGPPPSPLRLAIPGRQTTACRLAEMALESPTTEWVEMPYDKIMPAVLAGDQIDAGVIIHESRFVYQDLGLQCALDLGRWWEEKTGLPLPLGVMLASKDLDPALIGEIEQCLRASISLARRVIEGPQDNELAQSLWQYLRTHAVELEDQTIRSHIELYVTNYSLELGQEGMAAISKFAEGVF